MKWIMENGKKKCQKGDGWSRCGLYIRINLKGEEINKRIDFDEGRRWIWC